MNELTMNIEKWAKNKGLDQAQPEKQMLKVIEELGEVGAGMIAKIMYWIMLKF